MDDPRIANMFANESPAIRFIAAALAMALGPAKTSKLIDQFSPRDIDWTEVVAGAPMHHWNGKTRSQVVKQVGEEGADKVAEALKKRELKFPEPPKATESDSAEPGGEEEQFPGDEIPPAGTSESKPAAAIPPAPQTQESAPPEGERVFAGYPYSELRGKTDDELRAMPNIGDRTIAAIREFEAGGA